jgi:hypothetical protein
MQTSAPSTRAAGKVLRFFLRGVVREAEMGISLPGLSVKAFDKDLAYCEKRLWP